MISREYIVGCLVCNSDQSEIVEFTSTMMGTQNEIWIFQKCKECSFIFLSPRVKSQDLAAYYTSSYLPYRGGTAWGKYANMVENDLKKIDTRRTRIIQKYLSNTESNVLLDIGCGKPSFLEKANELLSVESHGIDFSNEGWKDNLNRYEHIKLYEGEVSDLPSSVKADVVTMWHYLEHDYNPQSTLRKLSASQKDDSILVIEVPNYDSYTRKKYGKFWSGFHSPRHTGLYTPETMKKLLESCGWKVVKQYTYGTLDPYTLDWMSRMEEEDLDWTMSMESQFFSYVYGKIIRPRYFFHKLLNLGFMTTIARNVK